MTSTPLSRACERPTALDSGMAETPQGAFSRPDRRRSRQGRGLRRADCRKTRGEPADRERTFEDIVAIRPGEREACQAVDVLQARRGPHRETEDVDSRKDLKAAVRPEPPRAKTPPRSASRNAGPA